MRVCRTCSRHYKPSSGHLDCPRCRARAKRKKCVCGNVIWVESTVCLSCHSELGELNPNWKGGRTYHKAGYILVRADGHPRLKKSPGYVFEHILVMESVLGRFLIDGETVHHRNGIRGDNRPENLELWTKSHPSGVRVQDLKVWAEDFLETYKDISV